MRPVRIYYNKTGKLKYISHLDINRVMLRMIRRGKINVWFTEGFHQHPYVNFALPLSLGFESESEAVDMRINDDMTNEEIMARLSDVAPDGMEITAVCNPIKKFSEIAYADFYIVIKGECQKELDDFLSQPQIIVEKTTKKGGIKQIDLKEKIVKYSVSAENGDTALLITLPAGTQENINPNLVLAAFSDDLSINRVVRRAIYDSEMNIFA